MTIPNLFIRCTHTGLYQKGNPNNGPVLINDLDVGYEQQWRKVPCYVPRWANPPTNTIPGFIDIPMSSRSMLSFDQGVIRKAVQAGLIEAGMYLQPEVYTNITRPLTSVEYPAGVAIWNTDDVALNWSDGLGNWVDYKGLIT